MHILKIINFRITYYITYILNRVFKVLRAELLILLPQFSQIGLAATIHCLLALPDAHEDLQVHVDEADEGQDPGGEGGVPDQRQRVPEDEVRVPSGF